MNAVAIRSVTRALPFRPYVMHLTDGRSFTVRHPECVVLTDDEGALVLAQPDDSLLSIDLGEIVSLDVKTSPRGPVGSHEG